MKHSTFIQHTQHLLCTLALLFALVGTAWGDVLKTIDFTSDTYSSYRNAGSIADKTTVDDCYFVGGFPISGEGIATFPTGGNGANSRYLAIHVTGIKNGKIRITINNTHASDGTSNGNWKCYYGVVEGETNVNTAKYPTMTDTNRGTTVTQDYTMTTDASDAIVFLSRQGSLYTSFGNIEISTPYNLTYNLNGGSTETTPTQEAVFEGGTFTLPAAPAKSGATFLGWSDGTNIYAAGATYTMGSADVTLNAVWCTHTVTSGTIGSTTKSDNIWWTHFSPSTTIKAGETYRFSFTNYGGDQNEYNWALMAGNKIGHNGDGVPGYQEYFGLKASKKAWKNAYEGNTLENITLSGNEADYFAALKEGAKVDMTVTFKDNLVTINAVTTATSGKTYSLRLTSDEITADEIVVFHTVDHAYLTDYTVSGPYDASKTHTITYETLYGDGTGVPAAVTAQEGDEITLPTSSDVPEFFGINFSGWWSSTTGWRSGGSTYRMGSSDLSLTASYGLAATKKVNFDGNGKSTTVSSLNEAYSGYPIHLPSAYNSYATITSNATWDFADGWLNNGAYKGISVNGSTVEYQEAYYTKPVPAGNVLTKTESGLAEGTYEIVMSVAASYTQRNGVEECPTGNGLTVAFAGNQETNIPVINRRWVSDGGQVKVAFTVEVTDGTLTYGLKNNATSGNWYIINIESLRKVDTSNFEGWYTAKEGGDKASDPYTIGTDDATLYAHWSTPSSASSTIILEQRGYAGTAGGTFTNSTCTSNIAFSDQGGSNVISSNSTYKPSTTAAYITGGTSSITIGLNSTSASEIVIGGMSIGNSARQLSSISVDGTVLDPSTYTITGEFPAQSSAAYGRDTITGLNIPQGSSVTFNFDNRIRIAYFEITPSTTAGKSTNTDIQSVTVHGMALTADADGNYTYYLGTGYESNTINMVVTPSSANATIDGKTGAQTISLGCGEPTATAITGNTNSVTVTAEDGETSKAHTITIYRIPQTETSSTKFLVSDVGAHNTYYEGMQCYTPDDKHAIKATISTTYGYPAIPGKPVANYANSTYYAYGATETATTATNDENGIPTGGVYYRFDVNNDGYIEMGIKLDKDKVLKVVDAGGNGVNFSSKFMTSDINEVVMSDANTISEDATGYIQFPVVTGKTYYVYAVDSKLGFMGFDYQEYSSDATASFKHGETELTFTNGGYDISDTDIASGGTYTVNIKPATNAEITSVSNATATGNETDGYKEYNITVPAEGNSVSAVFMITAQDGKTTNEYTIRITKKLEATTRFSLTMKQLESAATANASGTLLNNTYAEVTGGSATIYDDETTSTLIGKDQFALLNNTYQYIKIELDEALKEGDVISFTPASNISSGEICFTTDATMNVEYSTLGNKYTVDESSALIGQKTIYVWRTSISAYIKKLEINAPYLSVIINGETITCSGGDGTEGNPKKYSYDVPLDYTDSTVPVKLISTGTLSEEITSLTVPTKGNQTSKTFTITYDEDAIQHFNLVLNRATSSDCSIIAATANGYPATINGTAISAVLPYGSASSIPVTITLPTGATVVWQDGGTSTSNAIELPGSKTLTVTADDGTTKAYTFTLTQGSNDIYLVTSEGQKLYLTEGNVNQGYCTKANVSYHKDDNNNNVTDTFDGVEGMFSILKKSDSYIQIYEQGAISFTATISQPGKTGRNVKIQKSTNGSDWITCGKLATDGLNTTTSLLYTLGTNASDKYYIRLSGQGSEIYAVKLTFYTETKGKEVINLTYSKELWEEGDAAPTLTAKNENGDIVALDNLGTIKYVSDDETVATVSSDGTFALQQNANGSATIYASTEETDNYYAASASFEVRKLQGYSYDMAKVEADTYNDLANYQETSVTKDDKTTVSHNPKVLQQILLKDEEGNTLVTGTFGGWNFTNSYTCGTKQQKNEETGETETVDNVITDGWNSIKGVSTDDKPVDGFKYSSSGVDNARDESLKLETLYGEEYYGAFHPAEKDADGNITTYPFTLPVRGTYMTFEPTVNGTLSIYILQNGAWGNDAYQYRRHAFFLTDQDGRSMADYTSFSTTVKKTVTDTYTCVLDAYGNAANDDPNNIGNWEEFQKYFSASERLSIQKAWSSGVNGTEKMVVLDNGSFLVTQKACVKYTFYAIAGQTYYLFANKSKMGFCGMNFVPDVSENSQPTAELDLSENLKYDKDAIAAAGAAGGEAKTTNVTNPQYKTITLDRTFTKDYWNTICIPFTMTVQEVKDNFGDNAEIILLDNITVQDNVGHLHFIYHEIQELVAGYPYIIKPGKTNTDGITVSNKTINPNTQLKLLTTASGYTSRGIEGYCDPHTTNDKYTGYSIHLKNGDIFLKNGAMWVCGNNSYLKGYRAYMEAPEEASSQAKSVVFDYRRAWEDEDEATQIDLTEFDPEALESLGIVPAGVYNLNGQKIAETTTGLAKGVYIVNGKKMIRK